MVEERPWGGFFTVYERGGWKVKILTVLPSQSISLQSHKYRDEDWLILEGEGSYQEGEDIDSLHKIGVCKYFAVMIERGILHRIENTGTTDLVILEVQSGVYLGEDDITRYSDQYGRV